MAGYYPVMKKLVLSMPGDPEVQQDFWQRAIVDTGLEPNTEMCLQANAHHAWNDSSPAEMLANHTTHEIAEMQYDLTMRRIQNQWMPKPPKYVYLDFEPHGWQWDKLHEGYNLEDLIVLHFMRRGVQKAIGVSFSTYRIPILFDRVVTKTEVKRSFDTSKPFTDAQEWTWMDCYWRSTANVGKPYIKRLRSHYKALSRLGKPIIPFVDPRYRAMTPRQCMRYFYVTTRVLRKSPTLGIWTHQSTRNEHLESHTENVIACQGILRQFLES